MAFAKLNSMKFVGLDGLSHFWSKAKTWIIDRITTEVTAKITEIVANAPENLDTLKEIADWISTHEDSASAMNTAILANTEAISGKADKSHTHTKSQITDFPTSLKNPNVLTVNGKTYDGSTAVDAGVQTIANGGTGVTTQAEINKAFIGNLDVGNLDVTDSTEFVSSYATNNGFAETAEGALNKPYKRKFIKVWNYIKGKISSVLGLTKDNYGGKASTAGTADNAKGLKTFFSWRNPYVYDETNGVRYFVFKITLPLYFNSILVQVDSDLNYAQSRKYILGLWHSSTNDYGYNVSVTDLGGTYRDFLRVWLGKDGNVYLQTAAIWGSRILFSNLDEDAANITVEKIGSSRLGSNTDLDGNVLFTPLADPIIDCGAISSTDLSTVSKQKHYLKSDEFIGTATNATNDSNGKNIANTYMPKSGGTFNGSVTFEKPTYFNDEIHSTALFPKGDIDSFFSFFKDKEGNNLPRVFSCNCGDVFKEDMCLRYYTLNCSNKNEALKNLNELKKLFASMYPHNSSDYASCVSIHGSLYVSYNDSTPTFGTSYITNYGYCSPSADDAYVRKDGSIYVGPDFECSYHILYTSDEEVLTREYDAYILAEEILVKNLSRVNVFACSLHYVLAEHL